MSDYKRDRWESMVEEAREDFVGTCPLVEDEAILWAHDRITALESALRDCLRHMKTAGSPEAVRACEAAEEELLGVRR